VTRRLNIAIATGGRFHVLDLARELHELGHQVKFYSYVPRARARRFGLPDECHVSLLPLVLPAVAWQRLMPRLVPIIRERVLFALLNRAVMTRLHPCDVFICMSGIYLEAAHFAKERYGAMIWLERGSRHILSQDEILAAIPGAGRPSPLVIRRELADYALADRIVIPSHHVGESFRRDGSAYAKLFYNPYGVDLAMFPLRQKKAPDDPLSLLFAGTWCLRKGCDLLAAAVTRATGARVIHIGAIGDMDFPANDARFVHVDSVPQRELTRFYAAADVFVLASREDGLGVVLPQALASGLPVICTDRTGGADLAHTPSLAARISVVPAGDIGALAQSIAAWRDRLREQSNLPPLSATDRETLSWAGYGRRYRDELLSTIGSGLRYEKGFHDCGRRWVKAEHDSFSSVTLVSSWHSASIYGRTNFNPIRSAQMKKLPYLAKSIVRQLSSSRFACPNCGDSQSHLVARKYAVTQLRRCRSCLLMYRAPSDPPGTEAEMYEHEYAAGFTTELPTAEQLSSYKKSNSRSTEKDYAYYISVLQALGLERGERVFDFGCSWGYGSYQLQQAGFKTTAFELAPTRRRFAETNLGVICVGDMDRCVDEAIHAGQYGCFFSAHVIEHVPMPSKIFEYARRLLRAGGLFLAFAPNGSETYRLRSRDWMRSWGQVHPNLIDEVFLNASFRNSPRAVGSSPVRKMELPLGSHSMIIGSMDGPELVFAARYNGTDAGW
jgi:glycosyltransferase involved in cell wall biosynthesis